MFPIFPYLFVAIGLAILVQDFRGRFRVPPRRLRLFQWVGIAAAAGPTLAPPIAWATGRLQASWPFGLVALVDVLAFALFAVGVLRRASPEWSTLLRRLGYILILLVAALPSWVLIIFAPFVALAAAGLAQPRDDEAA